MDIRRKLIELLGGVDRETYRSTAADAVWNKRPIVRLSICTPETMAQDHTVAHALLCRQFNYQPLPPIAVRNDGDSTAYDVEVDRIHFFGTAYAQIQPVDRVIPAKYALRPRHTTMVLYRDEGKHGVLNLRRWLGYTAVELPVNDLTRPPSDLAGFLYATELQLSGIDSDDVSLRIPLLDRLLESESPGVEMEVTETIDVLNIGGRLMADKLGGWGQRYVQPRDAVIDVAEFDVHYRNMNDRRYTTSHVLRYDRKANQFLIEAGVVN